MAETKHPEEENEAIDSQILDIVTILLTVSVLVAAINYFDRDEVNFNHEAHRRVAQWFYCCYSVHLFFIIRAFRHVGIRNNEIVLNFGPSQWINKGWEKKFRYVIIIIALCVSGHLSTVVYELYHEYAHNLGLPSGAPWTEVQNFTFFAFLLSLSILVWNLMLLIYDILLTRNWKDFKKYYLKPYKDRKAGSRFKKFFHLFPMRSRYLLVDSIAFYYWYQFFGQSAFDEATTSYKFTDWIYLFVGVYILLTVYRCIAYLYKYE